jgi:hypothetical protein
MSLVRDAAVDVRACIEACQRCHSVCSTTLMHCLDKGGKHASSDHIRLLVDCAEICATSAGFMLRDSPLHHWVCGACAAVCEACARDCEAMADDEEMRRCAAVCHECAELCRTMAG